MSLLLVRGLVACACLALAATSNALPVTIALTGHVTATPIVPEMLAASIQTGAGVTGLFRYDDERYTPGALFLPTTYAQPEELGLRLEIGGASIATDRAASALGLPFSTTTYAVQVLNDQRIGVAPDGVDRIAVFSYGNSSLLPSSTAAPVVQLFFVYPDLSGLDSASILELEAAVRAGTLPEGFGVIRSLASAPESLVSVSFAVDSIWVVPEPAPAWLAGGALLGLALRRCRTSPR